MEQGVLDTENNGAIMEPEVWVLCRRRYHSSSVCIHVSEKGVGQGKGVSGLKRDT